MGTPEDTAPSILQIRVAIPEALGLDAAARERIKQTVKGAVEEELRRLPAPDVEGYGYTMCDVLITGVIDASGGTMAVDDWYQKS